MFFLRTSTRQKMRFEKMHVASHSMHFEMRYIIKFIWFSFWKNRRAVPHIQSVCLSLLNLSQVTTRLHPIHEEVPNLRQTDLEFLGGWCKPVYVDSFIRLKGPGCHWAGRTNAEFLMEMTRTGMRFYQVSLFQWWLNPFAGDWLSFHPFCRKWMSYFLRWLVVSQVGILRPSRLIGIPLAAMKAWPQANNFNATSTASRARLQSLVRMTCITLDDI